VRPPSPNRQTRKIIIFFAYISQTWWHMLAVPATMEDEMGESLKSHSRPPRAVHQDTISGKNFKNALN
jgi:hypothetical protein